MIRYKTLYKEARAEQIIDKSRFIVTAAPVESREEAEMFFDRIRTEFRDATHNVPAMVIGEKMQIQWGSDDGEPQGTSGAPIVQMLVAMELTNVAIVVTRYFGGIKLGTGGLVRAYTSSARMGVEAAGIAEVKEMVAKRISTGYSEYSRIESFKFPFDIDMKDLAYTDKVTFTVVTDLETGEETKKILMNLTNGDMSIISEECILSKREV